MVRRLPDRLAQGRTRGKLRPEPVCRQGCGQASGYRAPRPRLVATARHRNCCLAPPRRLLCVRTDDAKWHVAQTEHDLLGEQIPQSECHGYSSCPPSKNGAAITRKGLLITA